jgi:DNA-binding HxlR family transcriptional regulator
MTRPTGTRQAAKRSPQPDIRRYEDACGTAHGLELLGDRWALLVVRELLLGSRRFSQLRSDLPGISANVLTQRLTELEERGIVSYRKLPPPASVSVYELTPWGYEAEPVVLSLGRWAARSPIHDPTLRISAVSMMLSLRTMFDASRAQDLQARIEFRFGEDYFRGTLASGQFVLERGEQDRPEVIFEGTPQGLAAAVHGGASFDELEAAKLLRVTGDRRLAKRFVRLFPLPGKASVTTL